MTTIHPSIAWAAEAVKDTEESVGKLIATIQTSIDDVKGNIAAKQKYASDIAEQIETLSQQAADEAKHSEELSTNVTEATARFVSSMEEAMGWSEEECRPSLMKAQGTNDPASLKGKLLQEYCRAYLEHQTSLSTQKGIEAQIVVEKEKLVAAETTIASLESTLAAEEKRMSDAQARLEKVLNADALAAAEKQAAEDAVQCRAEIERKVKERLGPWCAVSPENLHWMVGYGIAEARRTPSGPWGRTPRGSGTR